MKLHTTLLVAMPLVGLAALPAQSTVVDYPDSILATPSEQFFPFYTIQSGAVIRYQTIMPGDFAGLPTTPQIVSRIGLSIAGQVPYSTFVLRAGVGTNAQSLASPLWSTNLPDQRVQADLSGTVLQGGLTPNTDPTDPANYVNQWVEIELDHPFFWNPGESIVIDLTCAAAVPPNFAETTVYQGGQRRYRFFYMDEPDANSNSTSNVIKFRTVFEQRTSTGSFSYGEACANPNNPQTLTAVGSSALGSTLILAPGGGTALPGLLFFGVSRRESLTFGSLPLPFLGCALLQSWDFDQPLAAGSAFTVPVPNDPALIETTIYSQWAQVDGSSPASIPFGFSAGLATTFQP
jgi:hypothetical protein